MCSKPTWQWGCCRIVDRGGSGRAGRERHCEHQIAAFGHTGIADHQGWRSRAGPSHRAVGPVARGVERGRDALPVVHRAAALHRNQAA